MSFNKCLHQPVNERGLHGVESLRGRTAAAPQTETRLASYDGMARALCFPSLSAASSSYYIYRRIDGSYHSLITYMSTDMSKTCSFGSDILSVLCHNYGILVNGSQSFGSRGWLLTKPAISRPFKRRERANGVWVSLKACHVLCFR